MSGAIGHRGPDGAGTWSDPEAALHLGHRRLSVLDVSDAGGQPMVSACGRWTVAYNGELYNHMELRVRIEREAGPVAWRGGSDTETLLASVAAWGFPRCLEAWNGMFAVALWDRRERTLAFARDRLGEKPLYFGVRGPTLLFGSELPALRVHPDLDPVIDRASVAGFLGHSVVPAPHSIYEGIAKLEPGRWVVFDAPEPQRSRGGVYWDLAKIAERGRALPARDAEEAEARLPAQLRASVRSRTLSDVPLGAFLSGGIDSSLVVALMQSQATRPVSTFSIGFEEPDMDEAPHARRVAEHLGTDHTELYVSPAEAMEVVPRLGRLWSEPFADPSQVPTLLVSRLARREVTVALSGDGGDELFGGYRRYADARRIWASLRRVPRPARLAARAATRLASTAPAHALDSRLLERMEHTGPLLSARDGYELYLTMVRHWKEAERVVPELDAHRHRARLASGARAGATRLPTALDRMMLHDGLTYLPDVILTKVDRASMSAGLEARAPLLDHELVELAWSLPAAARGRGGVAKAPLRDALLRHVPAALVDRPKMGFGIPVGRWLRGPLRDWAESLLSERALAEHGLLDVDAVRRRWLQHAGGTRDWQAALWDVLMFQSWYAAHAEPPR